MRWGWGESEDQAFSYFAMPVVLGFSALFLLLFSLALSQFVCLCDAPPQAMKIRHVKRGLISVFMAKTQHQGTHTPWHTHTHTLEDRLAFTTCLQRGNGSSTKLQLQLQLQRRVQCVASWNTKFYSGTL